jgi:hypothetical protein
LLKIFATKTSNRAYFRETIQYDTLPSSITSREKDNAEDNEGALEDDTELLKTCKFYEQLNFDGELYKLGDFVYIKYQNLDSNQQPRETPKLPLIVRIDRLWTSKNPDPVKGQQYFLRGPVFLRPTDISHEATKLFYKNEVYYGC